MPPNRIETTRIEKTRIETNRACPSCKENNPDESKFCNHCGGRLEAICRACGQTNPVAANFCNSCGQLLDGEQKKPTLNRDHSRSYPMDAIKSKTHSNHNIVQGERKRVTVLFADTVNYTAMSETLDPEEVHGIMDGCSRILTDQVQRFEGKVNQFTGDGIMALFGAPLAQEDHAQKACYAALAVQEALVGYSKLLNKRLGINFNMRIGLNSGLVIVGGVGSDQQMDYTAIGDTVNLASRMEGLAKPGSIWVSENTHQLAREYFVFDYLGKFQVKGKVASQKSYRLIKAKHVNSRLDAAAFRGFTPYTGRKEELTLLEEAFAVSQAGKGQVVGISGEPGAGKSRLAHELKSRIGPNGVVAEGRCVPFGGAIAFLPLRDILRELFGVGRTEHPRKALLKITANLKRLDLETEERQAVCQDLLALPVSSETWQNMPPKKRKEKTFGVLREIIFRLADIRPLILIIDDLHWMDKTSEEFYDDIIDKIESVPILLLLLYRPEYRHTWAERSHYRHIVLDQLQSDISEKFIRSILIDANVDGAKVTAELTRFIATRSSGNPLFMEELTRTLLAKAAIKFENDGYVLDEDIASKHIPENIYGIIASRIDRLDDDHKQVIQTASVIGRDFTYRIINALLDFEADLKGHLKFLQDLKLIYPNPGSPEQAYLFKHVLIQEVAYNSLLRQKRSQLHEQIAVAIETLYPERIEEFYEVLAHHYEKSDNVDKAYEYLRISGEKASRTHFLWEAYDFFKRASKVLDRGRGIEDQQRRELEVLHLMIIPIVALGLPEDSINYLEQGIRISEELNDQRSLVRFYGNSGIYYANRGKNDEGVTYTQKAYETAVGIGDVAAMAQVGPDFAMVCMSAGRYPETIETATQVTHAVERVGRQSDYFGGMTNIYSILKTFTGFSMGMQGEFPEGIAICEAAIDSAVSHGGPETIGYCECQLGVVLLLKGRCEQACRYLNDGVSHLEEAKFYWHLPLFRSMLGLAEALLGQHRAGLSHIESALGENRQNNIQWRQSIQYLNLGICRYLQNEYPLARQAFQKAHAASIESGERHVSGKVLVWSGLLESKLGLQDGEAEKEIFKGIEILRELGTRPDLATAYHFLGQVLKRGGKDQAAWDYLNQAKKSFHQLGIQNPFNV